MGCDDIDPGVHFHGYDEFLKNMEAWQETDSCEINYSYRAGVGPYGNITTIRDGDSKKLIPPEQYKDLYRFSEEHLKNMGILFYSMTDIYNYIQNRYEYLERNCDDDEQSDIYVEYDEIRGRKYPVYFHADNKGSRDFILQINSYREEFSSEVSTDSFDVIKCKKVYEDWKQTKPSSYSFDYCAIQSEDADWEYNAEVTVTEKENKVVPYLKETYRYGDEIKIYDFEEDKNPQPAKGDKYYIESMDDLFEKVLSWYAEYQEMIESRKAYFSNLYISYEEDYSYVEDVDFMIDFQDWTGYIGHDGDDVFSVKISNFKILE